jgi:hypothetical protein
LSDFDPHQLFEVLEGYDRERIAVERQCAEDVVEWRYADDAITNLIPPLDQIDRELEWVHGWRFKRPNWLKDAGEIEFPYKHGFDVAGLLRTIEYGDSKRTYVYDRDRVYCVTFAGALDRYDYYAGTRRVEATYKLVNSKERQECTQELFLWDGDQLVRSERRCWIFAEGKYSELEFKPNYHYFYGSDGELDRCVRYLAGPEGPVAHVVYKRAMEASITAAMKSLEDCLVEYVVAYVRDQAPQGKLYAIFLSYCGEDITAGYPGHVVIGFDDFRQQCLAAPSDDHHFWEYWISESAHDANEKAGRLQPEKTDRTAVEEKTLILLQLASEKPEFDYQQLTQLLCRVAMRLNAYDWTGIIDPTDDFIVFAEDPTGDDDFNENLKASAPPQRLSLLRDKGILPTE